LPDARRPGARLVPLWVCAAVLAVAIASSRAEAQIVNVQSILGEDVREGFSFAIDASVDWRTGNVDLLLVSGAATIRYKRACDFVFLIVKGDYGRAGNPSNRFLARTFEHLRYRRALSPWLTVEAFGQHESDQFRRITLRALAGVGPRFALLDGSRLRVAAGLAYMIEHQRIRDDDLPDAADATIEHRVSTYLVAAVAANDQVKIVETIYAQPRVDAPGDLRVLSELSLLSRLSTRLTLKTAFVVAYDASPPLSIEELDTTLQTALSASF
jgi:hypothetical protein